MLPKRKHSLCLAGEVDNIADTTYLVAISSFISGITINLDCDYVAGHHLTTLMLTNVKFFLLSSFLFITLAAATQQPSTENAKNMKDYIADTADITHILRDAYFKGIYDGDVNLLGSTFYHGTLLFGDAAGKPYFKTIAQYLDGVKNRQSPKDSGKPFKGEIVSIKVVNSIAIAEVKVKMYDFNYHEFLSFHKLDGRWLIVNKMISDVNE